MAMDDTLKLAQAVVVDGCMARPERYVDLVPEGAWIEAEIVDVSLYIRHSEGFYFGTVRFQVAGEPNCRERTFHQLWGEGWTTIAFRDEAIAAAKKEKRRQPKPCTSPTGRTDGHGTYIKNVKGKIVCAFCLKPDKGPKLGRGRSAKPRKTP